MKRADRGAQRGGRLGALLAALALVAIFSPAVQAQPFESWLNISGSNSYVKVPASTALNPTGAITIEAWVNVTDPGGCSSIIGKNWKQAWWVGICGHTLRSYLRGYNNSPAAGPNSFRDAGDLPPGVWTHIAVVFNGTQRLHYVNGELAGSWAESDPLTISGDEVWIGSDTQFQHSPSGAIDEVRLWNVARTQSQIRSAINVPITTGQPGLVALWPFNASAVDVVGGHNGMLTNPSGIHYMSFAAGPTSCGSSTTSALCLQTRFQITTKWRTNPTPGTRTDGDGHVVVFGPDSGIFWFFNSNNWEVMVKAINACGLNSRYWIYSAATTDQFYRMEIFDFKGLKSKIYFNYPGAPAPALTDSSAFATCP
jgi:hypothetical protein